MKNHFSILIFQKLFNSDDSDLTLLCYLIIYILIGVIQGKIEILGLLFASLIVITILKRLREKYLRNIFNICQDIFLLIISCLILIMQIGHKNDLSRNTLSEFEIVLMIYEEFLILNVLNLKIMQGISLVFYLSMNLIWIQSNTLEIAYLILMKITMFFIFRKKKQEPKKFSDSNDEFNLNLNYEKTFIITDKKQLKLTPPDLQRTPSSDHNDPEKNMKTCFDFSLQKLEIIILGEFPKLISVNEFKKCLIENKKKDPSIKLQDFIEKLNIKNAKNNFFIGEGHFFSETENNLIFLYKTKDEKMILKVSRDILYDELSKIRQTNGNYSKAISFVAHEFRTPLNCIVSMLQTLDQQIDPKLSNNFIMPAIISSKFLLNMVSDLLDISQIEAEKFKLVSIDFDLKFLMQDTLQIVVFQAMKRGIELKMNFDNSINRIKSDPNRIKQIIINLLSNAIKYTTQGTITLSAKKIFYRILISVEDTGLGIDPANLDNLFKAFGKVTNAADSALNAQGVGLGLLISNKLALILNEMEEGIKVESALNKGSKFSFQIFDCSPQEQITVSSHRIGILDMKDCKMFEKCGKQKSKTNFPHFLINLQKTSSENISDLPSLVDTDTLMANHEKTSNFLPETSKKADTFIFTSLTNSFFFVSDFQSLQKVDMRNINKIEKLNSIRNSSFGIDSVNEVRKYDYHKDTYNSSPNSLYTYHGIEMPNLRKDEIKVSKEESTEVLDVKKRKQSENCLQGISNNTFKNKKLLSENNLSYAESSSVKNKFFIFQNNQQNSSNYIESTSKIAVCPSSPQVKIETPPYARYKQAFSFIRTSPFDISDKKSHIENRMEQIRNMMHGKTCKCPSALVVDDNDFNILALSAHLERLGLKTCSALSGDQAVKKISEMYETGKKKKNNKKCEDAERRLTDFSHNPNDLMDNNKNNKRSKTEILQFGPRNRAIKIVNEERKGFLIDSHENSVIKNKSNVNNKTSNNSDKNCCNYFKIIFLDLEMPGKNGLETYEIILKFYKKQMMLENLNVIAVTAYERSNDMVAQMFKEGAKDVIVKPVSLEAIALSMEIEWLE